MANGTWPMEILVLSFIAGAAHMIAPDHWIPTSILSWRRSWDIRSTLSFSSITTLLHLCFGVSLYFALDSVFDFQHWSPAHLTLFAASLILGGSALRALRFRRVRAVLGEVRYPDSSQFWGIWSVVVLLGPSEALIPILAKTQKLGVPAVWTIAAFAIGSLVSVSAMVLFGKAAWDRPFWLPRVLDVAQKDAVALSFAIGMILGVSALLT